MYHKLSISETLTNLDVKIEKGLSSREALNRGSFIGKNLSVSDKPRSIFEIIFNNFKKPYFYILIIAALISALIGKWTDSIVISVVLIINAAISVLCEKKAEHAFNSLKKLNASRCIVRRDGELRDIDVKELVVGDVVLLNAGSVVPADLRLTSSEDLTVNESALTGELAEVVKQSEFIAGSDLPIADRVNMAFHGTVVISGRGQGVVVASGMSTQASQISGSYNENELSITKKLRKIVKLAGISACAASVLLIIIGIIQGGNIFEVLLNALTLTAAVIPEGIISAVTVVLALGVSRMISRHAILRRITAAETLGCVTVICADRPTLLAQNKMNVVSAYFDGKSYSFDKIKPVKGAKFNPAASMPLLHGLALCNNKIDQTDLALLEFANKFGVEPVSLDKQFPLIKENYLDSNRKLITTLHRAGSTTISYTKGTADMILPRCTHIWADGAVRKLNDEDIGLIKAETLRMTENSQVVIALAMRSKDSEPVAENMIFIGLTGVIGKPCTRTVQTIRELKAAGIRVVMITDEDEETAAASGKQLGIYKSKDQLLSGYELDDSDENSLSKIIDNINIFANVNSTQKTRVINALKAKGQIVSIIAGGANDTHLLKAADLGVSMETSGTEAAKAASDLILADNNFNTLSDSIKDGLNILENIRQSIFYILSGNLSLFLTVFLGILFFHKSPLLPLHILWTSLVANSLPAIMPAVYSENPGIMKMKPQKVGESLIKNNWFNIIIYGDVITILTLIVFLTVFKSSDNLETAQTYALLTLIISQMFHLLGIKSGNLSIFKLSFLKNRFLYIVILAGIILQILVVYIAPVAHLFDIKSIPFTGLLSILLLSLIPLAVHELEILLRPFLTGERKTI